MLTVCAPSAALRLLSPARRRWRGGDRYEAVVLDVRDLDQAFNRITRHAQVVIESGLGGYSIRMQSRRGDDQNRAVNTGASECL